MAADSAEPSKYTGPGSCSSPSCHGGVQARDQTTRAAERVQHLGGARQTRARLRRISPIRLERGSPRSWDCRVPTRRRAAWLAMRWMFRPISAPAPSISPTASAARTATGRRRPGWVRTPRAAGSTTRSLELGLYDTRDLVKRSEKCLTCHLGTPEKIGGSRADRRRASGSVLRAGFVHVGDAAALEGSGHRSVVCGARHGGGASRAVARAAEARGARIARRHLARIRGAGLLRLPSQPDRGERQLAAGARLRRPASRQSAVQSFALRGVQPRDPGCRSRRCQRACRPESIRCMRASPR